MAAGKLHRSTAREVTSASGGRRRRLLHRDAHPPRECGEARVVQGLMEGLAMRTIVAIALIAASMALAACNTIEGAGRDVSSAGHAVSDTARDAK